MFEELAIDRNKTAVPLFGLLLIRELAGFDVCATTLV